MRTTSDGVILQQRDPNHFNGEYILSVVGGRVYFATYGNFQYGVNFQSNTSVNDARLAPHHGRPAVERVGPRSSSTGTLTTP